jgi:RHS repeat-associated protein
MSSRFGVQAERERRFRPMAIFLMMAFLLELIPASAFADPAPPKQQRVVTRQIDLSKCPKFDQHGNLLNPEVGMPHIPTASNPLAWAGDAKPDEDEKREDTPETDPLPKVDEPWFKHIPATNVTTPEPDEEKPAAESTPAAPKRYAVPERKPRTTTTYSTDDKALKATPTEEKPEAAAKSESSNSSNNSKSDGKPNQQSDKDDDKKPSSGSSSSGSAGSNKDSKDSKSNKDDDKDKDHDKKDKEDKDDHKKDRDHDDDRECHGDRDLGLVLPPLNLNKKIGIRTPGASWARLTSQFGSFFEMKAPSLQAYVNDYAVAHTATFEKLGSGKTTIVWDVLSEDRSHNKTGRKSYASVQFTITNFGAKASDAGARYTVETKVWDQKYPHGRKLQTISDLFHLTRYQASSGFNLVDIGNYTVKEYKNGSLEKTTSLTVSEPPIPDLTWMRRTGGKYTPIFAPFSAQASDEWFMRNKPYDFPVVGGRKPARKTIEWNWMAPAELKINKTAKRSYMTVRQEYEADRDGYSLETKVYDQLHPKGRLYKRIKGKGNLAPTALVYGVGLPSIGKFKLQEKIDGVETELFELEGRTTGSTIKLPQDVYVDGGPVRLEGVFTTAPLGYVEKTFVYEVKILNSKTGAVIRTLRDQIIDNTKNVVNFEPIWDGKDSSGQQVAAGTEIQLQMNIEVPHDIKAEFAAIPATARKMARGRRNVPERQFDIAVPHEHTRNSLPKSSKRTRSSGSGQGQSGEAGMSGGDGLVAQVVPPPVGPENFTVASADPDQGVTHIGKMYVTAGPNANAESTLHTVRIPSDPLMFSLPPVPGPESGISSITFRFVTETEPGVEVDTCGEFGPIWLYSDKGFRWYLGSQSDYETPVCQTTFTVDNLQAVPFDQNNYATTVSSTGLVTRYAVDTAPNSKVNVGGVDVKIASGRYDISETDLVVRSPGMPIVISRSYFPTQADNYDVDSLVIEQQSPPRVRKNYRMQFGWVWNFERHLSYNLDETQVVYRTAVGRDDTYTKESDGFYHARRKDDFKILARTATGFTLTDRSGHVEVFKPFVDPQVGVQQPTTGRAYLVSERDTFGNSLTYLYNDAAGIRCARIVSNSGQSVAVKYAPYVNEILEGEGILYLNGWVIESVQDEAVTGRIVNYFSEEADLDDPSNQGLGAMVLKRVTQLGGIVTQYDYARNRNVSDNLGQEAPPSWTLLGPSALRLYQANFTGENLPLPWLESKSLNGVRQTFISQGYTAGPTADTIDELDVSSYSISRIPGAVNMTVNITRTPPGDSSQKQSAVYTMDSTQRVTNIKDSLGFEEKFVYNDQHNITDFTDKNGNLSKFIYDSRSNLKSATDAKGNLITATYTAFDKPETITRYPGGQSETTNFYYEKGTTRALTKISEPVDGKTAVTRMDYNDFGQLTSLISPNGQTWTQTYNAVHGALESRKASGGATWLFENDNQGRRVKSTAPGPSIEINEFEYDERDRVKFAHEFHAPTASEPTATNATTSFTYTAFDAVNSTTDSLGRTTVISYDEKNFRPNVTTFPDGSTVSVTYDKWGNVQNMTNQVGGVTTYTYDDNNRVTNVSYPGVARPESFTYFNDGLTKTTTKTDGKVLEYDYDLARNLKTIKYDGQTEVTYDYDGRNRVISTAWRSGAQNYSETYHYEQNVLKWKDEPGVGTTIYEYDASKRRTKRTDPDGFERNYTYTDRDELKSVAVTPQTVGSESIPAFSMDYVYNDDGSLDNTQYSNGVKLTQGYDSRGRVTSKKYANGATNLLEMSWGFNAKNQRVSKIIKSQQAQSDIDYSYTYNTLDQLLTAGYKSFDSSQSKYTYEFDANANLNKIDWTSNSTQASQPSTTNITHNDADQVTAIISSAPFGNYDFSYGDSGSVLTYEYDSQSNIVNVHRVFNMSYDYKDQLVGAVVTGVVDGTSSQNTVSYEYDPSNRLRRAIGAHYGANSTDPSQTTSRLTYEWDGDQIINIKSNFNAGPFQSARYLLGNDREASYKFGRWHVLFTDDQSTQMGSADASGQFEGLTPYTPTGATFVGRRTEPEFGWQGAKIDISTGLLYMRNRWYNPVTSSFVQRDPIRYGGGLNMHAFGAGDPINKTDPMGLDGELTLKSSNNHSWIEYRTTTAGVTLPGIAGPMPAGTVVTYGTWDKGAGQGTHIAERPGVQINFEKDMKYQSLGSSKPATINSRDEKSLFNYIRTHDNWEYDCNCSSFATGAWQAGGQEPIDPISAKTGWLPTPWNLAKQLNPDAKAINNSGSSVVDSSTTTSSSSSGSSLGSSFWSSRASR